MSQTLKLLAVAVVVGAALVGCSSTDTVEDGSEAAVVDESTSAGATDESMTTAVVTEGQAWGGHALDNPDSLLSRKIVYFDFDRYDVKPEDRPIIEEHARYLQRHPNARISLQGHADERGTREYNNALGENRAKAVRSLLTLTGGSAQQIQTLSYGEERPANRAHTEEAWAQNRRVEIVYLSRE